jgi:hypothetical protein
MAITFIDAQNANNSANDDITVTGYSGIQDNDLILGFYHCFGDPTTSALPVTLSGFTKLADKYESNGTDCTYAIFYKIASSESGNYTFTGSHPGTPEAGAHILVFRGVDTTTPIDVTYYEDSPGFHYARTLDIGGSPYNEYVTPPNITTNTNNAWCVILNSCMFGSVTDIVPPSDFIERSQIIADQRNGEICTKEIATAGAVNPDDMRFTNVSVTTDVSIFTIALRPAGTGATLTDINLVNFSNVAQASLTSLKWDWFDQPDPKDMTAPTDQGTTEITDSSGNITISMPSSTLTSGQTGFLTLRDASNNYIGGYRLDVD